MSIADHLDHMGHGTAQTPANPGCGFLQAVLDCQVKGYTERVQAVPDGGADTAKHMAVDEPRLGRILRFLT